MDADRRRPHRQHLRDAYAPTRIPPSEPPRIPVQRAVPVRCSMWVSGLALVVGLATALFWEGPRAFLTVGGLLIVVLVVSALVLVLWSRRGS